MLSPVFQKTKDLEYSFFENTAHWSMNRPHYHENFELYLQTNGTREIFFQSQSYLLKPGTLCIITPYILHSTKNINEEQKYSRYLINFSEKIFRTFLGDDEFITFLNELFPCIIQLNQEQTDEFKRYYNKMADYWDRYLKGNTRGKKLAYIEVYRLLDYLIQLIGNASDISELKNVSVFYDSDIYDVLFYISRHYSEEIELDDMVKLSHMSRASFYRAFKTITGDTFGHYLNQYRAVMAHKMLTQTKLSLNNIAVKTGFSSTAHLTRIFKEIYGISPSQYRHTL